MSESVFAGLCRKVGSSIQVNIRREVVEFKQLYMRLTGEGNVMYSGSRREGFRMAGSDVDFMVWPNGFQVIWNLDQAQNPNTKGKIILCDCSESPPGFTLLELILTNHEKTLPSIVRMNDKFYVSSSKYRREHCGPNATEHGPCEHFFIEHREFDYAYCLQCDFWPPSASLWIDRCHSWPDAQLVHDIVRNGCHIVAIGHKLGNHADNEWRISFSQAEQKIVYSMNHSQFLTYGLLKIFLKEIINNDSDNHDKLLCSYHMKTAVFWAIQQNTISRWCPQNILECFWVCFKFLLKWVYEGVCPNFFIPENNMFLVNIHGQAQKILFCRLYGLYKKGLACLFLCPPSGAIS
ncbi:uncharacterized protein LOC133195182 [Saccostrea echinata]|uniref:uncharacterized protein LOC133195182 n=1 Tax=Saccostrea echinata TaxID=191078 RepID=UPI002A7F4E48|nr:uncharacterized protein LOC133195182 [Saccostrea echinata]